MKNRAFLNVATRLKLFSFGEAMVYVLTCAISEREASVSRTPPCAYRFQSEGWLNLCEQITHHIALKRDPPSLI